MRKVTLDDIAKEVGVSAATVSYVLNNKPSHKISEETRLRIIQVASLLQYKRIDTNQNRILYNRIGLYTENYEFSLINSDIYNFINKLCKELKLNGYELLLLPVGDFTVVKNIDALLCLGVSDNKFIDISLNNTIPVIAIDSHKHIEWTFEISHTYKDVKKLYELEEYILLTYDLKSDALKEEIRNYNKDVYFINNYQQLENIIKNNESKNFVICGDELIKILINKNINIFKYNIYTDEFLAAIIHAIKKAISHDTVSEHFYSF